MPSGQICAKETIAKAQRGDAEAYEALYNLHKRRIFGFCLRHTGNVSDAEDLTQDVFMQVFRKVGTFRGEAEFGSWLYRIAFNFVLMHRRKRGRNPVSLIALEDGNCCFAAPHLRPPIERVELGRALNSLPTVKKNIVLLHDVRGFSHSEVAKELGVTVGASRSQLHKAHLALRDLLDSRDVS